ncbi:hypothetical protein [Haloarchaeobius sp. DFWS5]|uniref:hypothetical protein n=1 Tax=Haloarchaeobius sp. DFWS5 TaxID=3446114 RepID=UPI003EBF6158
MNRTFAAGVALTGLGLVGYLVGLATQYTGRAFSLTGIMVGLTLMALGSGAYAGGDDE